MPNRWESSSRPLFVKTVYVNGNRHAILSQEDPLLRSRNSFLGKSSRPNSSFSFGSDTSATSSESQEFDSIEKSCRGHNPRELKNISSELQNCLVKLRLGSSNDGQVIVTNRAEQKKEIRNSTIKSQKWRRGRKKKIYDAKEKFKEKEYEDCQNKDHYRYVYHFENRKGKKNYCFVKISSEPSGVILNSVCGGPEYLLKPEGKNLVISAAFHNLVISPYRASKISDGKRDYFSPIENSAALDWNNYLTRSYYTSLSERVIQWLDMIKKQKRERNSECDSESTNDRIASGRTFLVANHSERQKSLTRQKESLEEDVESEVKGEPNVETALSIGKFNHDFEDARGIKKENDKSLPRSEYNVMECEKHWTSRAVSGWERRINQEKEIDNDSHNVTVTCRCKKNGRHYANGFEIATQEFPERNQTPINKSFVTQTRPASPQQQNKISFDQVIWSSDTGVGKPQLHIFIPVVPSKDSEENLSDWEPQITNSSTNTFLNSR